MGRVIFSEDSSMKQKPPTVSKKSGDGFSVHIREHVRQRSKDESAVSQKLYKKVLVISVQQTAMC